MEFKLGVLRSFPGGGGGTWILVLYTCGNLKLKNVYVCLHLHLLRNKCMDYTHISCVKFNLFFVCRAMTIHAIHVTAGNQHQLGAYKNYSWEISKYLVCCISTTLVWFTFWPLVLVPSILYPVNSMQSIPFPDKPNLTFLQHQNEYQRVQHGYLTQFYAWMNWPIKCTFFLTKIWTASLTCCCISISFWNLLNLFVLICSAYRAMNLPELQIKMLQVFRHLATQISGCIAVFTM